VRAADKDIDFRLLIPFLAHVVLAQTLILVIRITTSYRTIELGLPVVWLGTIATGFAIVPTFTALSVGRWIDRGCQGVLDRRLAHIRGLRRILGFLAVGDQSSGLQRSAWIRSHVLHGRSSDARGARRGRTKPRKCARLLHGRSVDRTRIGPVCCRLACGISRARTGAAIVRDQLDCGRCERRHRAHDQAAAATSALT